jgi:hypothetical protein
MKLKWLTFCKDKVRKHNPMTSWFINGFFWYIRIQETKWRLVMHCYDRNIPQNIQYLLQCIDAYPIIYYWKKKEISRSQWLWPVHWNRISVHTTWHVMLLGCPTSNHRGATLFLRYPLAGCIIKSVYFL